jgi:hypothetical protein
VRDPFELALELVGERPLVKQTNKTFCGVATLSHTVAALGGEAPDQEEVLLGTNVSYGPVLDRGMTLDALAAAVRASTGKRARVLRNLSLAGFRRHLRRIGDGRQYLVNFQRGPIFGWGGGHHSPLGGYLADTDEVLVLDVNPSVRPFLIRTELLWKAMREVDAETGKPRGLIIVER